MWIVIPLMLIPISFAILMMGLVRVWMFSAPTKIRRRPKYSMHVLREQREAPPNYEPRGGTTDRSRAIINSYSDDQNAQQSYDEGKIEKVLHPRFYDEYPRQVMMTPRPVSSGFATPSSGYYGRKEDDDRQVLTEAKFM